MDNNSLVNSINQLTFDTSMSSKDSNTSNILGDLEYQDYRNKFWSSTPNTSIQQSKSGTATFQPLGKEESYNRHQLIRSETFPVAKDDSYYTSSETFDVGGNLPHTTNKYLKNMMNAPSYVPTNYTNKHYFKKDETYESLQEDYNKLKGELILKNQIIKNLTDQVNMMTKNEAKTSSFALPKNHYQLFQDLSKTLQDKSLELQDTNQRLEAVLVATNLSGTNYDTDELSHKVINKITLLSDENCQLLQLLGSSSKLSLMQEIGILQNEIQKLKSSM